MKINFNKIARVCIVLMMCVLVVGSVYGVAVPGEDFDPTQGQTGMTNVTNAAGKIWATVSTIVQILAIAAVVFAGLRYMFASADAKADIKKQTVILIIGAIFVFAATAIIRFVTTAADTII